MKATIACLLLLAATTMHAQSTSEQARRHYEHNDFEEALAVYGQIEPATMTTTDLVNYSTAAYIKGRYQQSLDIATLGLRADPANTALVRLAFYDNTELGRHAAALTYADALFAATDSTRQAYFDYTYLGRLLVARANELTDSADRRRMLVRADSVYAVMPSRFAQTTEHATLMRARIHAQLDSVAHQGLATPFYEQLADLIDNKTALSDDDRQQLVESYYYLIAYYHNHAFDVAKASYYARRLLLIDPDNDVARQCLSHG
jgi:tetratricopeptide (TPR) repeat protein